MGFVFFLLFIFSGIAYSLCDEIESTKLTEFFKKLIRPKLLKYSQFLVEKQNFNVSCMFRVTWTREFFCA